MAGQTKRSVDTELATIDQMQDSLMPALDFDIKVLLEATIPPIYHFSLKVSNRGVGPAFMKAITIRNEVDLGELYRSPLRTATISPGPGTTDPYLLKGSSLRLFETCDELVSSWSLWYSDVYDRWYRTRIVVKYDTKQSGPVETLIREFFPKVTSITVSYGEGMVTSRPDNFAMLFEGGLVIPKGSLSAKWFSIATLMKVRHQTVDGIQITYNHQIKISDMGFWLESAYPQFTLQIGQSSPFVLGVEGSSYGNRTVVIEGVDEFKDRIRRNIPMPPGVDETKLDQWGLRNSMSTPSELLELYDHVYTHLKAIVLED